MCIAAPLPQTLGVDRIVVGRGSGRRVWERMPRHSIDIAIDGGIATTLGKPWLRRIVAETLRREDVRQRCEVGLLLTTGKEVRRLNRRYRGQDKETDVLSFSLAEGALAEGEGAPVNLGQVVVSYPRAVRQAAVYGHSVEREVAFLTVHGVLHLLGYDHQTPADEQRMFGRQDAVLEALGITRE